MQVSGGSLCQAEGTARAKAESSVAGAGYEKGKRVRNEVRSAVGTRNSICFQDRPSVVSELSGRANHSTSFSLQLYGSTSRHVITSWA